MRNQPAAMEGMIIGPVTRSMVRSQVAPEICEHSSSERKLAKIIEKFDGLRRLSLFENGAFATVRRGQNDLRNNLKIVRANHRSHSETDGSARKKAPGRKAQGGAGPGKEAGKEGRRKAQGRERTDGKEAREAQGRKGEGRSQAGGEKAQGAENEGVSVSVKR